MFLKIRLLVLTGYDYQKHCNDKKYDTERKLELYDSCGLHCGKLGTKGNLVSVIIYSPNSF